MRSGKLVRSVLAFLVCISIVCLLAQEVMARDEFRLGFIADLSGSGAEFGIGNRKGIDLAVEEYMANPNRKYDIKVFKYDDQGKPEVAAQLATRVVDLDKVQAVVGPCLSGTAMSMFDKFQNRGVVNMLGSVALPELTARYRNQPINYIFRPAPDSNTVAEGYALFAKRLGAKQLGIVHETGAFMMDLKDRMATEMARLGMRPPVMKSFDSHIADVTPQLISLRDAGADVVWDLAYTTGAANVLLSADKINYRPKWFGTWGLLADDFRRLAGTKLVEGFYVGAVYDDTSPRAVALHQKVEARFGAGSDPSPVYTAAAWDGTRMILRALDKMGPDPKNIAIELETMSDFESVNVKRGKPFTHENHTLLGSGDIRWVVWQDGKIVSAK